MNLDIWAFVRIMVALEEGGARQGPPAALYKFWRQEWQEVDQQLADLSQSNFGAYSEMMMSTQIALELPPVHQAQFRATLEALIQDMQAQKADSKDPEFKKDLAFEIQGLKSLAISSGSPVMVLMPQAKTCPRFVRKMEKLSPRQTFLILFPLRASTFCENVKKYLRTKHLYTMNHEWVYF